MPRSFAILFMALLLYQFYAIPLGIVFAFLLTRRLIKTRTSSASTGITLAWTVAIFMPLVSTPQSFFRTIYSPWYLSFAISPPSPQFSAGALAITIGASLFSSIMALIVFKK